MLGSRRSSILWVISSNSGPQSKDNKIEDQNSRITMIAIISHLIEIKNPKQNIKIIYWTAAEEMEIF